MKNKPKIRNPIARLVRTLKPRVITSKKGKGSYKRRGKYIEEKNQCMNTEQQ
jgi:stalled ribosome alternative rescue factor ArfA